MSEFHNYDAESQTLTLDLFLIGKYLLENPENMRLNVHDYLPNGVITSNVNVLLTLSNVQAHDHSPALTLALTSWALPDLLVYYACNSVLTSVKDVIVSRFKTVTLHVQDVGHELAEPVISTVHCLTRCCKEMLVLWTGKHPNSVCDLSILNLDFVGVTQQSLIADIADYCRLNFTLNNTKITSHDISKFANARKSRTPIASGVSMKRLFAEHPNFIRIQAHNTRGVSPDEDKGYFTYELAYPVLKSDS